MGDVFDVHQRKMACDTRALRQHHVACTSIPGILLHALLPTNLILRSKTTYACRFSGRSIYICIYVYLGPEKVKSINL